MLTVSPGEPFLAWPYFSGSFSASNRVPVLEKVGRSRSGLTAARASVRFYRDPDTPVIEPGGNDAYFATESVILVEIVGLGGQPSGTVMLTNPHTYYGTAGGVSEYRLRNHPRCDACVQALLVDDEAIYALYGPGPAAYCSDERPRHFNRTGLPSDDFAEPTDIYDHDLSDNHGAALIRTDTVSATGPGMSVPVTPPTKEELVAYLTARNGMTGLVLARLDNMGTHWNAVDITPSALLPVDDTDFYYDSAVVQGISPHLVDGVTHSTSYGSAYVQNRRAIWQWENTRSTSCLVFDTPIGRYPLVMAARCEWLWETSNEDYPLINDQGVAFNTHLGQRSARPADGDNLWVSLHRMDWTPTDTMDLPLRAEWDAPTFVTAPVLLDEPVYNDGRVYVLGRKLRQRRGEDAGACFVVVVEPPQYNEDNELVQDAYMRYWPLDIPPERVGRLVLQFGTLTFTAFTDNKLWLMGIDGDLATNPVRRLLDVTGCEPALYRYKLMLANGGSASLGPSADTVPLQHLEAAPAIHME